MLPCACIEWLFRDETPDCATPARVAKAADIFH
jgi:hypothetical protein